MTTRRNLLRVAAAGAGVGAATMAGTGSAAAAVADPARPLGWIDVKVAYQAKGDGTGDDAPLLQKALNDAGPGGVVVLPTGNYLISSPLVVPTGVRIQGSGSSWYSGGGSRETVINASPSFSGNQLMLVDDSRGENIAVSIRDLTLRAADAPPGTAVGLDVVGAVSQLLVENVQVTQTKGAGIRLLAANGKAPTTVRFRQVGTWGTQGNGFELDARDSQFTGCLAYGSGGSGWRLVRSSNNQFAQCRSEHSARHGFEWTDDQPIGAVVLTACTTDQNEQDGFHLERIGGVAAVQFDGCCARRDGSTAGGRFSGVSITGCTAPVLLTGMVVTAFRDDKATKESPYYGLTVATSSSVGLQAAALSTIAGGQAVNWDGQGRLSTGPNLITGTYQNNATAWNPSDGLRSGPDQLSFASAGVVTPLLDPTPQPADQGLLTWAFDPSSLGSTGVPTPGTIQLVRVLLRTPQQVSAALVAVTGAGAGLTAGQNLVGLYGADGSLLASSADQSADWTGTGLKTVPLTRTAGVPAVLPAGSYWVALLTNGATSPGFGRGSFLSTTAINVGLPGQPPRYGQYGTGQTGLPAKVTFGQAANSTSSFWVALR
ncbi:glycosyl hydrolase family 28-related protein [Kitasatospora sp. NPDC048407]|uniref:right-handed parallel beta-helix repeat-containing protein n=1 Tax=Kitasatospora sp. NPDC048407 TaxID=3364051 RepID=UPI00371EFDA0